MYVEPRKMVQMSWFAGQKLRHRCREQTYGHQGGKTAVGWGWWCAELGDWDFIGLFVWKHVNINVSDIT